MIQYNTFSEFVIHRERIKRGGGGGGGEGRKWNEDINCKGDIGDKSVGTILFCVLNHILILPLLSE